MIKTVLASIPIYYMQLSWFPKSVCDLIDKSTRNFIWKETFDKGIHLVVFDKIIKPKKDGGLGIRIAR